ncbi:MAG: efflux RND transporter permease subunit [Calditrichaceae bacterium]|nr:efflux RND transporter permease subunit [Calditrichia bacterium]NUQ41960.1 efflux RND transporter permease subunit [Calditrichaceae bacterium]
MKITNLALSLKTSVFVSLVIVTILGLTSYVNLPVESFPDIKQPVVFVAVPYVGVAPADMETLIAQPIEDKLKEIAKIKKLTSSSNEGYTSIVAEFEPDMDIDEAVRKVREKVDQAKPDLPDDLEEPLIQEINFENIPIMVVSITGEQSLVRLKKIAEDLQDKFEEVPGVLEVKLSGGLEREVKVNVNPARLEYYNLGVDDVINAIRDENLTIPGGSMESTALKWTVRVPGEFQSVEEINDIVVKTKDGSPVYLRDLAEVYFGFKDQETYSRLNGNPSVTLSVQKRSGENIIRIIDDLKKILEEESKNFPASTRYVVVTDFSEDIRSIVSDLENNIIAGLLLVMWVLYFFMGWRNGLLVSIAIPFSMLISFIVISMLGYTLNMVVLFSLILALGMLVDNAIVIVENIYRHHQEGKSLMKAAAEGTGEVAVAVTTSTITTVLAFLPMLFWEGIVGEFMKFLPITVIITLSCSLLVGLVFNPVIASSFLKLDESMSRLPGDRLLRWLTARYEPSLNWALRHRKLSFGFMLIGFFGMLIFYGIANHGVEFFPTGQPNQIYVEVEAPLGTRLEASDQIVKEVEKRIQDTPDLKNYVANVGSSSNMFDFGAGGGSSHKSMVTIDLKKKYEREQNSYLTLDQVEQKLQGIPGARIDLSKPEEGPPTGKAVEIQIKGENFAILSEVSDRIIKQIEDVPGIAKLKSDYEKGKPEVRIRIDREKAALFGLNTAMVASTIRTAINGTEASEYRVGTDEYDITVRFSKDYRKSYNDLLNLTVFHEGVHYPLANFAAVDFTAGLSNINHVEGDRVVTITADAIGRTSAEVLADCKERLEDFSLPLGYSISFAGQDQEQQKAADFLMRAFMVAILLIFFVLVMQFNSITLPFVIMFTVILSLFGAFFGLLVSFKPFGIIMTGIGVISLAGVVVNNAIVLIDYIQKLRSRGLPKRDAIIEAGKTRMRPVLLTAITTILGLVPLTVGINIDFIGLFSGDFSKFIQFGAESSQWWSGMGVVVIFGLLFATALTLIAVPLMYDMTSDLLPNLAKKFSRRKAGTDEPGFAGEPQVS